MVMAGGVVGVGLGRTDGPVTAAWAALRNAALECLQPERQDIGWLRAVSAERGAAWCVQRCTFGPKACTARESHVRVTGTRTAGRAGMNGATERLYGAVVVVLHACFCTLAVSVVCGRPPSGIWRSRV